MRIVLILCSLVNAVVFTSCEKDSIGSSSSDYLVFGHFYGECGGERCIEIFKIENNRLWEDVKDEYPLGGAAYEGNFIELSADKYQIAQNILDHVPTELSAISDGNIGSPDAGDWGGYYVSIKEGSTERYWFIDTQKRSVPTSLHDFIDKIGETIQLINQ